MALITLGASPFVMLGGFISNKLMWKRQQNTTDAYRDSNALLSDMILNYRTVIGFGEKNINYLLEKYTS